MLIERMEVIPYALPFREPYVTARGRLERRELILLRVSDVDGVLGLGETTALSLRGGRSLKEIAAELEGVAALCASANGVPTGELSRELSSPEARCALAIAAMDLSLRRAGEPPAPAPVPCNATLSAGAAGEVAESARRWREIGFRSFKLKVGPDDDLSPVAAAREALGSDAAIRVDANGTWDPATARRALARLDELDVELCEQPVATLEEMVEVGRGARTPLAADESVREPSDSRRASALGACEMATLKLAKVGGPEVVERGEWGIPVYISSALDGPVGIAAAGRVAAALRADPNGIDAGIAHGLATQLLFSETIAARGPEVRDGMLHVPEEPGIGVVIDDDALARLAL